MIKAHKRKNSGSMRRASRVYLTDVNSYRLNPTTSQRLTQSFAEANPAWASAQRKGSGPFWRTLGYECRWLFPMRFDDQA